MKSNIMFYSRGVRNFNRFVVSSDFEKRIVKRHFLYDEENIVVTGLPRWDTLCGRGKAAGRYILIAPTWCDELEKVDDKTFGQAAFFHFWNGILTNETLLSFLRRYNVTIRFLLHIGMHRFAHLFAESDVVIVENGGRIGDLIRKSSMMVTDYSSIAFDMLFMEKPVVFCPYDLFEEGAANKSQFIDFNNDIPGPLCCTVDSVIHEIVEHVGAGFSINKKYKKIRDKYFKYVDSNNCERLYEEINKVIESDSVC